MTRTPMTRTPMTRTPMTRTPRFNHVALTLPRESLSPEARKEILDFYGDVFGWTELEQMTKDYQLLVLSAYDNEQFVYLDASDKPMQVAATDGIAEHFGMSVGTMTELDEMCGKAKGSTTLRNSKDRPAPSEVAASIYARGTVRTPWCAPSSVTTATLLAIKRTFDSSP